MTAASSHADVDAELTICSVSFHSDFYLDLNKQLVERLNDTDNWRWVIVDNAPSGATEDESKNGRISVLAGPPPDLSIDPRVRGSYHHAAGLNEVRPKVATRFMLVLDPDFYIVRRDWIVEVMREMIDRNLAFFGVPWHPRWYTKYRYFPCVHCLFVDLEKVRPDKLDFLPEIKVKQPKGVGRAASRRRRRKRLARVVRSAHAVLSLQDRRSIGGSFDTGYKVFRAYAGDDETRYDTAVPVYRPSVDLPGPRYAVSHVNRVAEVFLRDERCFIPKHRGAFTTTSFAAFGYPDVRSLGWEEFMWQGRPFGFHVRCHRQDRARIEEQHRDLVKVIDAIR